MADEDKRVRVHFDITGNLPKETKAITDNLKEAKRATQDFVTEEKIGMQEATKHTGFLAHAKKNVLANLKMLKHELHGIPGMYQAMALVKNPFTILAAGIGVVLKKAKELKDEIDGLLKPLEQKLTSRPLNLAPLMENLKAFADQTKTAIKDINTGLERTAELLEATGFNVGPKQKLDLELANLATKKGMLKAARDQIGAPMPLAEAKQAQVFAAEEAGIYRRKLSTAVDFETGAKAAKSDSEVKVYMDRWRKTPDFQKMLDDIDKDVIKNIPPPLEGESLSDWNKRSSEAMRTLRRQLLVTGAADYTKRMRTGFKMASARENQMRQNVRSALRSQAAEAQAADLANDVEASSVRVATLQAALGPEQEQRAREMPDMLSFRPSTTRKWNPSLRGGFGDYETIPGRAVPTMPPLAVQRATEEHYLGTEGALGKEQGRMAALTAAAQSLGAGQEKLLQMIVAKMLETEQRIADLQEQLRVSRGKQ